VQREGISHLTEADIREASQAGERWKLVGSLEVQPGNVKAQVKPRRLPLTHPLTGINGVANAICYDTRLLGQVTLIGPGAGRKETGFAILSDLLAIHRAYPQEG
jgi:homoserine dehydrogenase